MNEAWPNAASRQCSPQMACLLAMPNSATLMDVARYSARVDESVPIELDGNNHGHVAVVDLVAPQA